MRDGSGSYFGRRKNFEFGYGSGSGIGTQFLINRVLLGIVNLDRVFSIYHLLGIDILFFEPAPV